MTNNTFPHGIKKLFKAEVNDTGMKRCSSCSHGEKIEGLCSAHRCTVGIGSGYSYNDGCSFENMVREKSRKLWVSPHLQLAFSEMGNPSEEEDKENIAPAEEKSKTKHSNVTAPSAKAGGLRGLSPRLYSPRVLETLRGFHPHLMSFTH